MDTIILAAGENRRLQPMLPSHHKPLIVVNGQTLVAQCVRLLTEMPTFGRVTIVCAPQNVSAIAEVIDPIRNDVVYVVQPKPTGVMRAVWYGLACTHSDSVLVLCADNIIPAGAIGAVARARGECALTTAVVPRSEARRFTFWDEGQKRWLDHTDADVGVEVVEAWIGPLMVPRTSLANHPSATWAQVLARHDVTRIASTCQDVGDMGVWK